MVELRAENISKAFADGSRALDDVSFEAHPGRVLTLLGPSGCGKSTLLRIVAGLESATSGRLLLNGEPLDGIEPGRRGVGFVFQNYALYPHLSVAGNLSLALEAARVPAPEVRRRVGETAELLGIEKLLDRKPGQLSGGQQQRVALGRAIVRRPRLYLLDEPLSNLDALLREGMRAELKALFRQVGATVIYVTHDQTEAMSLSDDLIVLRAGRVLQRGAPLDVYRRPADAFVASFVGSPRMTFWTGRREGAELVCRGVRIPVPPEVTVGGGLCAGIRPEDVEVSVRPLEGGWPARRLVVEPLGSDTLLTARVGEEDLRAFVEPTNGSEDLWVRWPPGRIHWFEAASGRRLETSDAPQGASR